MAQWEGVNEFIAVTETGSFTAASKKLKISTAQVSRLIAALEQRLATVLLYRTTRKVSLTDAGALYYQHCKQVVEGLEHAEQALNNYQTVPKGKLRVTAPHTYGEIHIAPLLNDFVALYPEIEMEYELTNKQLDLLDGGFDLAIRLGHLHDSSLVAKRLSSRRQFVCASPDYLAAKGKPHTLSELKHHNCILGTLDYWRFQENDVERNVRVRGNLRCNSGSALLDAALKGLGLVQLPNYYVGDAIAEGELIQVLETLRSSEEGIWALYPNRQLSFKVRTLVDFLAKSLKQSNKLQLL